MRNKLTKSLLSLSVTSSDPMISYRKSKINTETCSDYVRTTPNVVRQLNDTASKENNFPVFLFPAVLDSERTGRSCICDLCSNESA